MLENLFHLPQDETEPLQVGEWFYELIWCPRQCYYRIEYNGADYMLYLRWRWENPWQAHIVQDAVSLDDLHKDGAVWSEDVFALHHVQFSDGELELAKEKI